MAGLGPSTSEERMHLLRRDATPVRMGWWRSLLPCCGPKSAVATFCCCCCNAKEGMHDEGTQQQQTGENGEENFVFLQDYPIDQKIVNPIVPFLGELPSVLSPGRMLVLQGSVHVHALRMSVNLACGSGPLADLAFHLNPRFEQNLVVRNYRIDKRWGKEETSSPKRFPFKRGHQFQMQIFITEEEFMTSIYIPVPASSNKARAIRVRIRGSPVSNRDKKLRRQVGYKGLLPKDPRLILQHSSLQEVTNREAQIRMQHPLLKGQELHRGLLQVAFNGDHFCAFTYRVPLEQVRIIQVNGDIDVNEMEYKSAATYPQPYEESAAPKYKVNSAKSLTSAQKKLIDPPIVAELQEGLPVGSEIEVLGRVKLLPQEFFINLQKGTQIWPHPPIALHINPRFRANGGVIQNAWVKGKWGAEVVSDIHRFRPGRPFSIRIACEPERYAVSIDGATPLYFDHRCSPDIVDAIRIQGDIWIRDIQYVRSSESVKNVPNVKSAANVKGFASLKSLVSLKRGGHKKS